MFQPDCINIQRPVPFSFRVTRIYQVINKSSEHDQYRQRKTDPEQADKSEELSSLLYCDGYFEIIFKHGSSN